MRNKFLLTFAWAFAYATAAAAAPAPTTAPSVPAASASAAEAALVYRSPGSPLTVGELASLQRKKLEQDYYKKVGMTTVGPGVSQGQAAGTPKALAKTLPPAAPKPQHQLVILGIYGPAGAERVELRYDGITHIATGRARIGVITLESLAPGTVQVLAQHAGKPSRHTLRPGDTLEVSQ